MKHPDQIRHPDTKNSYQTQTQSGASGSDQTRHSDKTTRHRNTDKYTNTHMTPRYINTNTDSVQTRHTRNPETIG